MILNLTADAFVNDFYTLKYTEKKNVVINTVKENFLLSGRRVIISGITIQVEDTDYYGVTTVYTATNIIGMSDNHLSISSVYPELQGVSLTIDNISSCSVELYE